MQILFIHQNFPAQFGHIAHRLIQTRNWRATYVSQTPAGNVGGIEKIQYKIAGGATRQNHFCSRTFENAVWHCDAVYQALKPRTDIKPDLIVGHSGFGSTLFLRELYPDVPVINLLEYYYRAHDPESDMDFRKDLGWQLSDQKYLRSRCRNAMILLDLQNCDAGYAPTRFQKSCFPDEYQGKIETIFDGIDRSVYHGHNDMLRPAPSSGKTRVVGGKELAPGTRLVTYVSRGFESMRGFDIFMRSAKQIAREFPDVMFAVVGSDRIAYGGDENYIDGQKSFREWVLAREEFDLSKFLFMGMIPPDQLARLLAASDLHIYLTVPFVLSWSMMNAMSCGAVVLASATSPVKEMIRDGENGLLVDFFDVDGFATKAVQVLKDPAAFRPLGHAAEKQIAARYSIEAVLPQMTDLYERTIQKSRRS